MTSTTTWYVSRIPIIDGGAKIPAGALFSHIQDHPCAFHMDANGEMIRVQAIHLLDTELFQRASPKSTEEESLASIPDAIKAIRSALGETQQEFAERLGCSLRALAGWETGTAPSRYYALLLIAVAEKVGLSAVVAGAVKAQYPGISKRFGGAL